MLPRQDCEISEDVCCASLFDTAYQILTVTHAGLLGCYTEDLCKVEPLQAYVTLGVGDDLVWDGLSVAIDNTAPSQGSLIGNRLAPIAMFRASFTVRLLESGWPMAEEDGGQLYPPDPVMQHKIARHAYAHGEKMYRTILVAHSQGTLVSGKCSAVQIGPLFPLNPTGGAAGWSTTVTMNMNW